jgi:anti-sigma B factor antagonist
MLAPRACERVLQRKLAGPGETATGSSPSRKGGGNGVKSGHFRHEVSMLDPSSISSPTFRLATRPDGDRAVVVAHGELDVATVANLEHAVRELRASGISSIVLDLRELGFMDSTGVRLLLQLDAEARADGFSLAIADSEGPVRRVLTLTGVAERLRYAEP